MSVNIRVDDTVFADVETITVGGKTLNIEESILPDGYTQHYAILAGAKVTTVNGNEVKTNYSMNSNSWFVAKARFYKPKASGGCSIFTDHSANGYGFAPNFGTNVNKYNSYRGGQEYANYSASLDNAIHVYEIFHNNKVLIDNVEVGNNILDGGKTSGDTMYILGDAHTNTVLYYLMVYENETLVAHYVPCTRDSDDAPGLYDIVGNNFYTNANWIAV